MDENPPPTPPPPPPSPPHTMNGPSSSSAPNTNVPFFEEFAHILEQDLDLDSLSLHLQQDSMSSIFDHTPPHADGDLTDPFKAAHFGDSSSAWLSMDGDTGNDDAVAATTDTTPVSHPMLSPPLSSSVPESSAAASPTSGSISSFSNGAAAVVNNKGVTPQDENAGDKRETPCDEAGAGVNGEGGRGDGDEDEDKNILKSSYESARIRRRNNSSRVTLVTKSEVDLVEDGFRWRKYGQKNVKDSPNPRSYYRCTEMSCDARKKVERCSNDYSNVRTTYEGKHNHALPSPPNSRAGSHFITNYNDAPPAQPSPAVGGLGPGLGAGSAAPAGANINNNLHDGFGCPVIGGSSAAAVANASGSTVNNAGGFGCGLIAGSGGAGSSGFGRNIIGGSGVDGGRRGSGLKRGAFGIGLGIDSNGNFGIRCIGQPPPSMQVDWQQWQSPAPILQADWQQWQPPSQTLQVDLQPPSQTLQADWQQWQLPSQTLQADWQQWKPPSPTLQADWQQWQPHSPTLQVDWQPPMQQQQQQQQQNINNVQQGEQPLLYNYNNPFHPLDAESALSITNHNMVNPSSLISNEVPDLVGLGAFEPFVQPSNDNEDALAKTGLLEDILRFH